MKGHKKADRAARKEERSGSRDRVERDKKAEGDTLVYSRANVVRDWERRDQHGEEG